MNRFVLLWAGFLMLALTACPSTKKEQAQNAAAPTASAPADFRHPGYAQYRGQLTGAADSLALHLTITPDRPGGSVAGGISGYYYGADGEPHELQQISLKRPQLDSLVLAYYDHAKLDGNGNEQETRWRLRRQPDGRLVGTVGGRAVQLRPVQPVLGLAVRSFADSVAAYPGKAGSPYGHVGLQTLEPMGSSRVALAVGANIRRLQRGDTLPNRTVPALAALWQQQRTDFSKFYREDATALADDLAADSAATDSTEAYSPSLRYESQSSASVICQQGDLLSLRLLDYGYSGGAHGNFGSTVRSFDLRTGRVLAFDDIFRPGARTRLLPLLERGVRRSLGIGDNERLDTQLLDNEMRLTTNACLTPGGVLFMYVPYEIAAYALGEVPVFIPLAELRPLLREGLPLPGTSARVAKR